MGPLWFHEVKHDGYRLLVRKSLGKVRIYTRRGADWTHRFPLIVEGSTRVRSGRAKSWLKIKNPNSPAALRIEDGTF
jgi:ATP-dependent DNA ligase